MQFNPDDKLLPEVTRILDQLEPQPLQINRDELFFQAGFAAGAHSGRQHFWPALSAALLLVSIGLSAVIMRQASVANSPSTVLSAASDTSAGKGAAIIVDSSQRAEQDLFFMRQQRYWQRLASTASLPPGRLTASGWEELPKELASKNSELESQPSKPCTNQPGAPDTAPSRPATYLELMRLQRES